MSELFHGTGRTKSVQCKNTQIPEIQPGDLSRVILHLHNLIKQFIYLSIFLDKRFHIDD